MNDYWEDKAANFEKITCPAYVVASYTSQVHAHGTFEGFRRLSSKEKWLRIHNTQEWSDQHRPENRADLLKFYDYYLKTMGRVSSVSLSLFQQTLKFPATASSICGPRRKTTMTWIFTPN